MKYVIYTDDKNAVDAAFNELGIYQHPWFKAQVSENGNHRVAVFSAGDGCFKRAVEPLVDAGLIQFLGCKESCNSCCRENPSENFTDDDKAIIDLVDAWELF